MRQTLHSTLLCRHLFFVILCSVFEWRRICAWFLSFVYIILWRSN